MVKYCESCKRKGDKADIELASLIYHLRGVEYWHEHEKAINRIRGEHKQPVWERPY